MRRTPTTDTIGALLARGGSSRARFERAYRELVQARKAYDEVARDPGAVPDLAREAARLQAARQTIRTLAV